MNRSSNEFLSGPRFARHQHGRRNQQIAYRGQHDLSDQADREEHNDGRQVETAEHDRQMLAHPLTESGIEVVVRQESLIEEPESA